MEMLSDSKIYPVSCYEFMQNVFEYIQLKCFHYRVQTMLPDS
uniref:Uncharacterized protein n=1 Tax=Arundo donax TaxID=35708 RepID=A0A0A8ZN84_ARUDO